MTNTDPKRTVQKELFERVYDSAVCQHFVALREGNWWVWDVAANRDRVVIPERRQESVKTEKTICLCHDIERGSGHRDTDPSFAALAEKTAPENVQEMLRIEKELDLKTTYNVLGCLFNEVRTAIERDSHCLAFHSYDHRIDADQLPHCRQIDYRIKGYRPPQSRITLELTEKNLCFHNFEWLASSAHSLNITFPKMERGIVKIPILFDDYDLYEGKVKYEAWEQEALSAVRENDFVAFSMHDCYAGYWLPHYSSFLRKIRAMGTLKTLNQVANEVILGNAG
jgi:hypothetical protein